MSSAIYLRKSRADTEEESIDVTLARHKKTLLEYAKSNNLIITEIYEEVVSGDGLFVRPEMIRLLKDVENGLYDSVVCMDIDRLGRVDTKDRGIIIETLRNANTTIITPNKTYDLNDEIDAFTTEIQMLLARQELKKITQRMRTGVIRTVKDGYYICEPPYGYRRKYIDKHPTLEICEEEAVVIRMIFDMYVNQHKGSHTIAEKLNELGYKTRKNTSFSRNTIRFILENATYIGKIVYNKRRRIKKKLPTDKNRSVLNSEDEWIVVDGVHPPIVDEDTYYRAKQIRQTRTHPPANTGIIQNPFAGIIRCSKCGEIMTRQTSKKTGPRLICNTVDCMQSTTIDKVENIVLSSLRQTFNEWQTLLNSSDRSTKRINNKQIEIQDTITSLKKQLQQINKQTDSLYDLLEQGVYTADVFLNRSVSLKERQENIDKQISEYQEQLKSISKKPVLRELLPIIETLLTNYDNMTAAEKNRLYKSIIKEIRYTRCKELKSKAPIELAVYYVDWI